MGRLLSILACTALAGCATTVRPADVSVREGLAQTPVTGAVVRVTPLYLHISGPDVVNTSARGGVVGRTDQDGRVTLDVPTDHAFTLTVIGPDFGPAALTLERHPDSIDGGRTAWMRLIDDPGAAGTRDVEVRLSRPDR